MSQTTTEQPAASGDPVTLEDVQRALQELRGQNETLTQQLESERALRTSTQSELGSERQARTVAEQERDGHAARAVSEAEQRWNTEKELTTQSIATQRSALAAAEESYARHAEAGEWKEAGAAQRQIAEAAAKLDRFEQRATWLETNKERLVPKVVSREQPRPAPNQPQTAPAAVPLPAHRYAQFIEGPLATGEQEWLDKRPQFSTDAGYRDQVFSASAIATKRGHPRGTPAHFRELERILGEGQPVAPRQQAEEILDTGPGASGGYSGNGGGNGAARPSADLPPSRRAAPGQQPAGAQQPVRLTPDEVEIADGMYGQPTLEGSYIADPAERYRHYYNLKQLQISRGRMTA